MTNFLKQKIAIAKHIPVNSVNLHNLPWVNPMVLQDIKPCTTCAIKRAGIWSACDKGQARIAAHSSLTVLDYEAIVDDFYHGRNKPKHCDYIMEGVKTDGTKQIALCDLTCRVERMVIPFPTGKREYAWKQMEETIKRWQAKAGFAAMIGQYVKKVFIFGWRDPYVPASANNNAALSMSRFTSSTTSANIGVTSFGTRGDFELVQVKYPATYQW